MKYPLTAMELLKEQEKGRNRRMVDFWQTRGGQELAHHLVHDIPKNTEMQKELADNIGLLVDAVNRQNALLQANNEMLAQILEGQQKTAVQGKEQGMQTIGKAEKSFKDALPDKAIE